MKKTPGQAAAIARWTKRNPEKVAEYKRRHRKRHCVRIAAERRAYRATHRAELDAYKRAWVAANPELVRMQAVRKRLHEMAMALNRELRWHYAITLAQYQEIEQLQNGACAICGTKNFTGRTKRLHVDHDHASGLLRALLCMRCNSALGYLYEHPDVLRRAAAYLEAFNAQEIDFNWPERVRRVLATLPEARVEERRPEGVGATESVA